MVPPTPNSSHPPRVPAPSRRRPHLATLLEVLHWFVGFPALVSGLLLVVEPTGTLLGWTPALLAGTVFFDFLVPGLVLALIVGGSSFAAAIAHRRAAPRALHLSVAAGIILAAWILIQMALVGIISALQPILLAVAVATLVAARLSLSSREPQAAPEAITLARDMLTRGKVAIVGLSRDPRSFSQSIATAMRKAGLDVVGINPAATDAANPAFARSLNDLPDAAERAVFVILPPARSLAAVEDAIRAGITDLWFHRGAGPGSSTPEALNRALDAGLRVVDGLCPFMLLEPDHWLHGLHRGLRLRSLIHRPLTPIAPIREKPL